MKKAGILIKSMLLVSIAVVLLSFDLPKGWFVAGDMPDSYSMGIDKGSGMNGSNAATIKSVKSKIKGFGTLMQWSEAGQYLGKRIRMSGYMKTDNVKDWAGFWLRVDAKDSRSSLSFDNMHDGKKDRSVKGTTGWTKYDIVLDVPANASSFSFGALLSGTGQVWFDDLKFEVVDNSVETTGRSDSNSGINSQPSNLDFEK